MRLPFSLTAPVSRQHHQGQNKPLDTLKMQLGLEQLGFLEPSGDDVYTSTASDGLFNAMKDF